MTDFNRIAGKVSYDGTRFGGFQIQRNAMSIQGEIEKVLSRMHKREVRISGAGRTDAGVHALAQVFHFDSDLILTNQQWYRALNAQLTQEIRIVDTRKVQAPFHARFASLGKEYRYSINRNQVDNPLRRLYTHHEPRPLQIDNMHQAAQNLQGQHDFTSFSSPRTKIRNKVREVRKIDFLEQNGELVLCFEGNGFLYQMVRIMVGTLLDIGLGKYAATDVEHILQSKDRMLAGPTAPAKGLCLWKVHYDPDPFALLEV